jgi:hypothetical protein
MAFYTLINPKIWLGAQRALCTSLLFPPTAVSHDSVLGLSLLGAGLLGADTSLTFIPDTASRHTVKLTCKSSVPASPPFSPLAAEPSQSEPARRSGQPSASPASRAAGIGAPSSHGAAPSTALGLGAARFVGEALDGAFTPLPATPPAASRAAAAAAPSRIPLLAGSVAGVWPPMLEAVAAALAALRSYTPLLRIRPCLRCFVAAKARALFSAARLACCTATRSSSSSRSVRARAASPPGSPDGSPAAHSSVRSSTAPAGPAPRRWRAFATPFGFAANRAGAPSSPACASGRGSGPRARSARLRAKAPPAAAAERTRCATHSTVVEAACPPPAIGGRGRSIALMARAAANRSDREAKRRDLF